MKIFPRFLESSVVIAVIIADQITKLAVQKYMSLYESFEVIKGCFNITYILNRGAAFGILSNLSPSIRKPFFIIISLTALGLIIYLLSETNKKNRLLRISYGMILAGASGNLIDRIFMGEVRDFLDFYWKSYHWPAFNIADSSICIGTVILILSIFFTSEAVENNNNNQHGSS